MRPAPRAVLRVLRAFADGQGARVPVCMCPTRVLILIFNVFVRVRVCGWARARVRARDCVRMTLRAVGRAVRWLADRQELHFPSAGLRRHVERTLWPRHGFFYHRTLPTWSTSRNVGERQRQCALARPPPAAPAPCACHGPLPCCGARRPFGATVRLCERKLRPWPARRSEIKTDTQSKHAS